MKKLISAVAAGALLLSAVGVVFASTELTNQDTHVTINAVALSNSGLNFQLGKGSKSLSTGDSMALTQVQSVANENATGSLGHHSSADLKNKDTHVKINALAVSNSGLNLQLGGSSSSHHGNSLTTGNSGAEADVASWANINTVGVTLSQ